MVDFLLTLLTGYITCPEDCDSMYACGNERCDPGGTFNDIITRGDLHLILEQRFVALKHKVRARKIVAA
jgi:hypothetical protein